MSGEQAALMLGLEEKTLRDQKAMAESFELPWRQGNLSFNHHREVSSLKQIQEADDGKLFLSGEPDTCRWPTRCGEGVELCEVPGLVL